jgi:hypothetical protein
MLEEYGDRTNNEPSEQEITTLVSLIQVSDVSAAFSIGIVFSRKTTGRLTTL